MLSVPFEHDLQKLQKVILSKKKPLVSIAKISCCKHNKSPIHKINSHKNLVPHGRIKDYVRTTKN